MKNLKKIISVTAAAAMVMSTVAPVSVFADDATFKIGGIGPVTGAAAIYGQAVKNATELAINEVNEDGGINGYQVEFKFEDDENDAEKTLNAYNALKDWGMNILVGTVTSTPCVAVANETAADNMFQLTPSGSATECVANPNVFRVQSENHIPVQDHIRGMYPCWPALLPLCAWLRYTLSEAVG